MKNLFTSLFFCVSIVNVFAQGTCLGLYLETQDDVDQFLIDNPTCVEVQALFIIINGEEGGITDLSGLSNLTTVLGTIEIYNYDSNGIDTSPLSNITSAHSIWLRNVVDNAGFSGITSIPGALTIQSDVLVVPGLVDLSGFDNLQTVGDLYLSIIHPGGIYTNVFPSLIACGNFILGSSIAPGGYIWGINVGVLEGFNALETLQWFSSGGWDWEIEVVIGIIDICPLVSELVSFIVSRLETDSWQSFESLQSVTQFSTQLFTVNNAPILFPSLENVDGMEVWMDSYIGVTYSFPLLSEVFQMSIFGNNWLPPIGVLAFSAPSLETVNGLFELRNFNSEVQLDFSALDSIFGSLTINATALTNLDAFAELDYIGTELGIYDNPNLTACSIDVICQTLTTQPTLVYIVGNDTGCDSVEEVIIQCAGMAISGVVFGDLNCNGIYDPSEPTVSYPIITGQINNSSSLSSSSGFYSVPVDVNSTYAYQVAGNIGYLPSNVIQVSTGPNIENYTNYDIALCPDINANDVAVAIVSTTWVPGFVAVLSIFVSNGSFNNANANVHLTLPNTEAFATLGSNYPYTIDGLTLTWANLNLSGFEIIQVDLTIQMATSVNLGTVIQIPVMVELTNATDLDASNDTDQLSAIVLGSFDPNDIAVNRSAIDFETTNGAGEWLTYRIRFQNTGTAPAEFITVVNEQSDLLDLASIQMISASHPAEWSFDDRQVSWFFEDIQLPDSTSDPLGSQGYILFKIRTLPGITLEDVVESTAAIYFDYNEPVVTNTATTVWYVCPVDLFVSNDFNLCEGELEVIEAPSTWDSFQWSVNGVVQGDAAQLMLESLALGVHFIDLTTHSTYCTDVTSFTVTVHEVPNAPLILQTDNVLLAEGIGTFSWTLNGDSLTATGNSITMTETGVYGVSISNGHCESEETSALYSYIGVTHLDLPKAAVYPNPARSHINVVLNRNHSNYQVVDVVGCVVIAGFLTEANARIDIHQLAKGTYVLELMEEKGSTRQQIPFMVE